MLIGFVSVKSGLLLNKRNNFKGEGGRGGGGGGGGGLWILRSRWKHRGLSQLAHLLRVCGISKQKRKFFFEFNFPNVS